MRAATAAMTISMLMGLTLSASAANERWTSTTSRDANGNICISFEEVQVLLPADWAGNCQMGATENSVSFYQSKSRKLYTEELGYAAGGLLFSVEFSTATDFLNYPDYEPLAQVSDGYYYLTFPTDVQGYVENEEAMSEYTSMCEDLDWIRSNVMVTSADAIPISTYVSDEEYILPHSSDTYLTESDLYGMDSAEVQMAINEIYARHHRLFVLEHVQTYFDSKSWYEGYIAADDFDVRVMNAYEGANINLMVNYMKTLDSSSQNITLQATATKDAYGMIIESGSGYFRVRLEDGSVIQFWYDSSKLADMGVYESQLTVGAVTSVIYDTEDYEAVSILVW